VNSSNIITQGYNSTSLSVRMQL